MSPPLAFPARLSAAIVALAGAGALVAQALVSFRLTGGLFATIWAMAGYFTVLTNLLVAVTFGVVAWRGRQFSAGWHAGLTLWILVVGVIYHLVLARLWAPEGLAWWADQGLHSAVPVLAALWWVAFAPKAGLTPRHAAIWLSWPLVYVAYALVRGAATARYPYPFIDVTALGAGGVARNVVGLTVAFLVAGWLIVLLGHAIARWQDT